MNILCILIWLTLSSQSFGIRDVVNTENSRSDTDIKESPKNDVVNEEKPINEEEIEDVIEEDITDEITENDFIENDIEKKEEIFGKDEEDLFRDVIAKRSDALDKRSSCTDVWNNCEGYVKQGYCKHTHVATMKANCCGSCSTCTDVWNNCASQLKYCDTHPQLMKQKCCGSCKAKKEGKKAVDNGCKPEYTNCEDHVRNGYCKTQSSWMKKHCCGLCKESKTKTKSSSGSSTKGQKGKGNRKNGCLDSANEYRLKHRKTPKLQWDSDLAKKAQAYAEEILQNAIANGGNTWSVLNHDPANGRGANAVGENLWYRDQNDDGDAAHFCQLADESWYQEMEDSNWNFAAGKGNGRVSTHFTQMVWAASNKVGYGVAVGDSPKFRGNKIAIVVAKYLPRANWGKKAAYVKNVQYPI